jgi:hypothetical protein
MIKFKKFLVEGAGKNLHMTHAEESLLVNGYEGGKQTISTIYGVFRMLRGDDKSTTISTKFDGAPAVFCGTNPENGKFFVGSKSVFNKSEPKINYTNEDIDKNHPGGLATKLKAALKYFPKLQIKGVVQCDLLFSEDEPPTVEEIDGEKYLTFRPNTITYAVPVDSDLAKDIKRAKIGAVFHTVYEGAEFASMTSKFDPNMNVGETPDVWHISPFVNDVSGKASLTKEENAEAIKLLKDMQKDFAGISPSQYDKFFSYMKTLPAGASLETYWNSQVRAGKMVDEDVYIDGLIDYMDKWWNKEAGKVSSEASKKSKLDKMAEVINTIKENDKLISNIIKFQNTVVQLKSLFIKKLNTIGSLNQFLEMPDGFKVTNPEGFVAIRGDGALKLVDRLEFSAANFNLVKKW